LRAVVDRQLCPLLGGASMEMPAAILATVSIGSIMRADRFYSLYSNAQSRGTIMFGKPKNKIVDTVQKTGSTYPATSAGPTTQLSKSATAQPAANMEPTESIASISSGMSIVGKIVCDGTVNIFGRIEGELRGSSVNVCNGARVEGNLVAEELTVGGSVRGTIHAARVKLQSTADVEGEIYHQLLSIEENARFEGTSKRGTKATDLQSSIQSNADRPLQTQAEAQSEVVPIAYSPGVAIE
jgi:cytoskeletal protein CcmA (bactofilin family)